MPESNQVCPIGSSVSRPELGRRFCTQQFSLAAQQIRLHQVVCGNQSPSAEVPMSWPYVTECKTLPTDLPPDVHHDVAPPLLWHLPHSCRLAPSAVVVGAGQLRDCERDDAQHLTYCTAKRLSTGGRISGSRCTSRESAGTQFIKASGSWVLTTCQCLCLHCTQGTKVAGTFATCSSLGKHGLISKVMLGAEQAGPNKLRSYSQEETGLTYKDRQELTVHECGVESLP